MKVPVILLAAVVLAGCVSQTHLAILPANDTNGPVRITVDEMHGFKSPSSPPALIVTVSNATNSDETFGPENVQITANGRPVRVFSAAELETEVRKEAEFRRYAAQTRAEMQAQVLEQDPAPPITNRSAIEVRANGLQESAAASWAERSALAELQEMLTPTVLKPGESITRRVVLHREDLRGATTVDVHIQLGNAAYPFTLRFVP